MDWKFVYRGLRARFRDQRAELGALVRALRPDDVAIDVGANKGSYLWALSRAVPRGRVVAFEPQPVLAEYLARACAASGLHNVRIEAQGVSAHTGQRTLIVPGDAASSPDATFEPRTGNGATRLEVPAVALDDYFRGQLTRIGAVKIDVEGHELAVLAGADAVIARDRPAIVVECEQRHLVDARVEDLIVQMLARGYAGAFIDRGALRPVAEFDPRVHQKTGAGRFWDQPGYCNNFVFLAREPA